MVKFKGEEVTRKEHFHNMQVQGLKKENKLVHPRYGESDSPCDEQVLE